MKSNQPRTNKRRHFWTPRRLTLTFLVLSLVAIGAVSSCNSSDHAPESASDQRGTPLPANVLSTKLQMANGSTISLGDYSGKVMLVNLWATWCGPCSSEIPELVKLRKEFQSQGFEIVGLSTENPASSAESVKNFVQGFRMDYPVGWASRDVAISLMQMSQRDAIPQSFIISRSGRVLKHFVGFNPVGTPPQIRQAIEDALKG